MIRSENHFDFSFPREVVWPVLSKTDWLNRALGFPPVKYDVKPALEGGSHVAAAASMGGLTLRWLEMPFEWLEPEFHRVRRVFDGGPLQEVVAGLDLAALPQDHCRATFYSEWTPRGMAGNALATFVLAPKSRRDLQRVLAHVQEFLGGRRKIVLPSLPAAPVNEMALQSGLTSRPRCPRRRWSAGCRVEPHSRLRAGAAMVNETVGCAGIVFARDPMRPA